MLFPKSVEPWLLPIAFLASLLPVVLASCASDEAADTEALPPGDVPSNRLTPAEKAAGWRLLFNGETFAGWTGLGQDTIPRGHWKIVDGAIHKVENGDVPAAPDGQPPEGGDLMTTETFRDFELRFEWKISPAGNSGVKYNVSEKLSAVHSALGFEYQVIDGKGHPQVQSDDSTYMAGALYDLVPPRERAVRPVGEWNRARIIFRGFHGEHWLNGEKILEYDLGSARFDSLLSASKYADIEGFATRREGHIVLQDHGDAAWYRNLKIQEW